MSLFKELKRRNVFRVGIAYLIVAWLLVQVADVMIDNIGAPDWFFQGILLVLGIGFPVVLIFAWAFEMTPEGLKLDKDVDRSSSIAPQTGRKLNTTILVLMALAIGYLLIDRFSRPASQESTQSEASTAIVVPAEPVAAEPATVEPSIAVLPFVNMSTDPEQEFFSDGIAEELLNLLVRVDGLKVASRTSSFTYKGENLDIPEIASELKVDHILEGSVRKSGNRVRITAQLIDTSNDRHLWSETFDRELTDIFAIQDEIANSIVSALQETLGVGLQAISVQKVTENLDAYELYLKARGLFIARQNLDESIGLFERAIELDPQFAQAWEVLAATHSVSASWLAGDGIDHFKLSAEAAERALEIDPGLSMPYAVMGIDSANNGRSYGEAVEFLDKAVANDPKNATAWLWRGITMKDLGYFQQAINDFERCLDIDSAYLNCKQHMAEAYLDNGQDETALRLFEETMEENFHSVGDSFIPLYLAKGQRVTALLIAAAHAKRPYSPVKDWIDALNHPEQDQSGRIARWQKWAEDNNLNLCNTEAFVPLGQNDCFLDPDMHRTIWTPAAKQYRGTSAFKELAREKLLDYWRAHGFPSQCRTIGEEDFECD